MSNHVCEAPPFSRELSFGLELQFLTPRPSNIAHVISNVPSQLACIMERDFTYDYLASALSRAGLPAAYIFETTKEECPRHPLRRDAPPGSIVKTGVSHDMRIMGTRTPAVPCLSLSYSLSAAPIVLSPSRSSRVTAQGRNPLFRYWVLKTEPNVCGLGDFFLWQPVELNSPILGESEATGGFWASRRALAAVQLAFAEDLHVSQACALHVHVSPARWELTPLHALRIATLVFLLEEPLLFRLCAPRRGRAHASLRAGAAMARPYSRHPDELKDARAAAHLPACLLSDASVRYLWTSRSIGDVAEMLARPGCRSDARATALGVKAQRHPDGRETHTLEFRHAEASLNEVFVAQWLALVTTICKVAWLDARLYKAVLEQVCAVVLPHRARGDAWRPLLRILKQAAPEEWTRVVCDESFWVLHLAEQDCQ